VKIRLTIIAALLLSCLGAAAAPYVVLAGNKKVTGTSVKAREDGTILLTTATGVLTFPAGTELHVDEPSGYARALQLIQQGQYDTALELLRKIEGQYQFLEWDKKARVLMAGAFFKKGDYTSSVDTYAKVAVESPSALEAESARFMYMEALLKSGQSDRLLPRLSETIATAPRPIAARAQVMRGHFMLERGELEDALYDFMRTAELFKDVKEWQAEAYYMTGECLDKLGDERAGGYFATVKSDFADSPFAAKARAR